MNFCNQCGESVSIQIPESDNRPRYVCDECETIHYQNPNIVAGILPIKVNPDGEDQVLLCRRAIEPRYGYWTLPAGFMENGESIEQGARREAEEEANLSVEDCHLYMIASIPFANQVYMLFTGLISNDNYSSGVESLDVQLFTEAEIPWDVIAFATISKSLKCYFADRKVHAGHHFPLHNVVFEKKGEPSRE